MFKNLGRPVFSVFSPILGMCVINHKPGEKKIEF